MQKVRHKKLLWTAVIYNPYKQQKMSVLCRKKLELLCHNTDAPGTYKICDHFINKTQLLYTVNWHIHDQLSRFNRTGISCKKIRVPTVLVTKISRTSQEPRSIFAGLCRMPAMFKYKDKQQLQWGPGQSPSHQRFFPHIQIKSRLIFFSKFWHLHPHHCVRLPHHSLENSRTFLDHALKFPGLSRNKPIFQDFPEPGNFTKRNPGLSRRRGNPGKLINTT